MMIKINERAVRLAKEAIADADALDIRYSRSEKGAHILDFGLEVKGTWESALIFTRLTLGDLGTAQLGRWDFSDEYSFSSIDLFVSHPLISCLGSQIAGWQLSDGEFATIGSGPARAAAAVDSDPYLEMTPYRDENVSEALLCIQDTRMPEESLIIQAAEACGVPMENFYIAIAPSACITGSVQVAARMLEQCTHKMYEHGFSASRIVHCRGRAPIAPVIGDEIIAMGRINDAILYGAEAEFWVDCDTEEMERIAPHLVSLHSSPCYGVPFARIFEDAGRNFYNIDHEVHSLAKVSLHNVRTGESVTSGEINRDLIIKSFTTGKQ